VKSVVYRLPVHAVDDCCCSCCCCCCWRWQYSGMSLSVRLRRWCC